MASIDYTAQTNQAQYHHVAVWKFELLSICTIGLYELYWFYKSWKFVQERDQPDILPFWRAVFAPIWYYSMARDLSEQMPAARSTTSAGMFAVLYFLLNAAAWQLSDPYWLISFLTLFLMIPMVIDVDSINRRIRAEADTYHRFSLKHIAVVAIGLPFFAFTFFSSLGVLPRATVTPGDQLPARVISMLEEMDLLEAHESVICFNSAALLSYESDGNYFTDYRVVSYWQEDGIFYAEQARYEEIEDIEVDYTNSFLNDTSVTVIRKDGSSFLLFVSGEEKKDREFVNKLKQAWRSYPDVS
jgi:hypothetical protein